MEICEVDTDDSHSDHSQAIGNPLNDRKAVKRRLLTLFVVARMFNFFVGDLASIQAKIRASQFGI
jgi:hypothetical protein